MNNKKIVLVTGASKGIGQAIAIDAAKAGYDIIVHYVNDVNGANNTVEQIKAFGGNAVTIQFNIADRADCTAKIEQIIQEHGSLYGVVLNAGIAKDAAFPALTDQEWDDVIHTNLDGFYNVLKPAVMPMVRSRAPGRIITLSSVSGLMGNRGQVNYSASKAGIIGATKSLAIELGKRNITVNCVAPGVIETSMTEHLPVEMIKEMVPLRRVGKPQEVAGLVTFLLSEQAAYITRQVISVNGGMF